MKKIKMLGAVALCLFLVGCGSKSNPVTTEYRGQYGPGPNNGNYSNIGAASIYISEEDGKKCMIHYVVMNSYSYNNVCYDGDTLYQVSPDYFNYYKDYTFDIKTKFTSAYTTGERTLKLTGKFNNYSIRIDGSTGAADKAR